MAVQSKAYDELSLLAQTYFELGHVGDMMEGLARASTEHPELEQQYLADKRAARPGTVQKVVPAPAPQNDSTRRSATMATRTTPPLDYRTRTALAGVDTLVVTKAISAEVAERLRTTITAAYHQEHPQPAPSATTALRTASTPRRTAPPAVSVVQASAAVQKQAAPSPPRSATDTLMDQIAQRQAAEPGLSVVAALDAVQKQAPELYAQYQQESRYPHWRAQGLAKQADPAPTYEQVLHMAEARVAKATGLSRRDALIALVQEHPHEQAYYESYRKYHMGDGLMEHHAAGRAQDRTD